MMSLATALSLFLTETWLSDSVDRGYRRRRWRTVHVDAHAISNQGEGRQQAGQTPLYLYIQYNSILYESEKVNDKFLLY